MFWKLFTMSDKDEPSTRRVEEPFMRRVDERRQSGYYIRKREEADQSKRKRIFNHDEAITIPLDVIVSKILAALPVKSLLRFRSVCKYWRDIISDPWFISLHLEHSKKNPIFLIAPHNPGKQKDISLYKYENMKTASLMLKHEFSETLQSVDTPLHANGLILLAVPPNTLAVCNPCTREFVKLPDGHHNAQVNTIDLTYLFSEPCSRAALCYVSSSNSYKVVQYFYRHFRHTAEGVSCNVGLEILTLGGKKECLRWEVAREDSPYPIDKVSPRAVGEFVYFRIADNFHRSTPKGILSYNVKDEKYRVVDLPSRCMTNFKAINIVDLEGDTCFTYRENRFVIDVWILSSSDFTLCHKFSINLLRYVKCVCFCQPIAVRDGKLLMHLYDGKQQRLGYYNPESDCLENVALIDREMAYHERENCRLRIFNQGSHFKVTSFVESLVTIANQLLNK